MSGLSVRRLAGRAKSSGSDNACRNTKKRFKSSNVAHFFCFLVTMTEKILTTRTKRAGGFKRSREAAIPDLVTSKIWFRRGRFIRA